MISCSNQLTKFTVLMACLYKSYCFMEAGKKFSWHEPIECVQPVAGEKFLGFACFKTYVLFYNIIITFNTGSTLKV